MFNNEIDNLEAALIANLKKNKFNVEKTELGEFKDAYATFHELGYSMAWEQRERIKLGLLSEIDKVDPDFAKQLRRDIYELKHNKSAHHILSWVEGIALNMLLIMFDNPMEYAREKVSYLINGFDIEFLEKFLAFGYQSQQTQEGKGKQDHILLILDMLLDANNDFTERLPLYKIHELKAFLIANIDDDEEQKIYAELDRDKKLKETSYQYLPLVDLDEIRLILGKLNFDFNGRDLVECKALEMIEIDIGEYGQAPLKFILTLIYHLKDKGILYPYSSMDLFQIKKRFIETEKLTDDEIVLNFLDSESNVNYHLLLEDILFIEKHTALIKELAQLFIQGEKNND